MISFDRTVNVGLHHFALNVENLNQLTSLHQHFITIDNVDIEFGPEQLGDLSIHHMMCIIADGVKL